LYVVPVKGNGLRVRPSILPLYATFSARSSLIQIFLKIAYRYTGRNTGTH
jgi:hypothetical protein